MIKQTEKCIFRSLITILVLGLLYLPISSFAQVPDEWKAFTNPAVEVSLSEPIFNHKKSIGHKNHRSSNHKRSLEQAKRDSLRRKKGVEHAKHDSFKHKKHFWQSTVTITNNGTEEISGEFRIYIDNANKIAVKPDGFTDDRKPYFNLLEGTTATFNPGESISRDIRFVKRHGKGKGKSLDYSVRLERNYPQIVLSPLGDNPVIGSLFASFLIKGEGLESATVTNNTIGLTAEGIKTGENIFIHGVVISDGENTYTVRAIALSGEEYIRDITAIGELSTSEIGNILNKGISVRPSPSKGDTVPLSVILNIEINIEGNPVELLIDKDGNGSIDRTSAVTDSVTVSYDEPGRFVPLVTVRTDNNQFYTNLARQTTPVVIVPSPTIDDGAGFKNAGTNISDMEYGGGSEKLYVLSADDAKIRVFSTKSGELIKTIETGASNPQGFSIGIGSNLLIADTGNHRIIRLLAGKDYQPDISLSPDGSFGSQGSGEGEFESPHDVSIVRGVITVSDTGNSRIQEFNRNGQFKKIFDGSESSNGAFISPREIAGGTFIDSGSGLFRRIYRDKDEGDDKFIGISHITFYTGGTVISDSDDNRIFILNSHYDIKETIELDFSPVDAALDDTIMGERLIVASATSNDLVVIPLQADPIGSTPLDVVKKFLDAFGRGDLELARTFLAENGNDLLDILVDDTNKLNIAIQRAALVTDIETTGLSDTSSGVKGQIERDGMTKVTEFILTRDSINREWKITHF